MTACFFTVAKTPIQVQDAFSFVSTPINGAVSSFVGMIRDHNLGKSVNAVSYDVHEKLAHQTFQELSAEVLAHYGQNLRLYVAHYQGRLEVGEISIVIAVGSPHRDEAFKACRHLIEAIKHRFPIWKQEHYADGDSEWVQGHALCSGHS